MAEFVRFTLDDGSQVLFESAESDLVALHGSQPDVRDGGKLTARLLAVAEAAEEVALPAWRRHEVPGFTGESKQEKILVTGGAG